MEISKSFHIDVNSTNHIRLSSANNVQAKTFGLHSISLAETAQEKANSLTSKESKFPTENNEIHDNQDHRDVNLQTDETLLGSSGNNRNSAENDNVNQIKHKRENIEATSIMQRVRWLAHGVVCFFKSAIMPQYENGFDGFDWKPTLENTVVTVVTAATTIVCPLINYACALKTTVACGIILNSFRAVGAKPVANVINIGSASTLQMIGRHADFPSDGNYILTANIDASNIMKPIPIFLGTLDGQWHTISHLQCCLMQTIKGNALIKNLIISDANTGSFNCTATTAGTLTDNATISFIQVLDSKIKSLPNNTIYAGIIANTITDSARVENSLILNSSIISHAPHAQCGGVAGRIWGDVNIENNTISHSNISASGFGSMIGGVAGFAGDGTIINQGNINQINVTASASTASAALIVGAININIEINDVTLANSIVHVFENSSNAGFAVGLSLFGPPIIKISNTLAICCHSIVKNSITDLWIGRHVVGDISLQISNSRAINCTLANHDQRSVTQSPTTEMIMQSPTTEMVTQSSTTEMVIQSTTTEMVTQFTMTEPGTQFTITEPVTQSTMTKSVTQFNITQSTITEPVMIEDIPFIPILLVGGCAVAGIATAVTLVSYSIYNAHQQGKRGWELVKHPGQSCVKWLTNVCQSTSSPSRPVQSENTGIEVTNAEGATETEMTPLSDMPIQRSDHAVALETDQFL